MPRLQPIDGTSIVDDIRVGHTPTEYNALLTFIKWRAPEVFIEIGVHEGGLSYILIPILSCEYIGVEIDCGIVREDVKKIYRKNPKASLYCIDCFGFGCYDIVSGKKNKIIYCDGGNKPKELRHFMGACEVGDIIMAHDFYDGTREVLDVEEVHPEVTAKDIEILDNDLSFSRIDTYLEHTRIIAWEKIKGG